MEGAERKARIRRQQDSEKRKMLGISDEFLATGAFFLCVLGSIFIVALVLTIPTKDPRRRASSFTQIADHYLSLV